MRFWSWLTGLSSLSCSIVNLTLFELMLYCLHDHGFIILILDIWKDLPSPSLCHLQNCPWYSWPVLLYIHFRIKYYSKVRVVSTSQDFGGYNQTMYEVSTIISRYLVSGEMSWQIHLGKVFLLSGFALHHDMAWQSHSSQHTTELWERAWEKHVRTLRNLKIIWDFTFVPLGLSSGYWYNYTAYGWIIIDPTDPPDIVQT